MSLQKPRIQCCKIFAIVLVFNHEWNEMDKLYRKIVVNMSLQFVIFMSLSSDSIDLVYLTTNFFPYDRHRRVSIESRNAFVTWNDLLIRTFCINLLYLISLCISFIWNLSECIWMDIAKHSLLCVASFTALSRYEKYSHTQNFKSELNFLP